MTSQPAPSDELLQFVKMQAGLWRRHTLSASTAIESDLGLTGIDADEFMEAFFQRFSVSPGDYDGNRYFGPEGVEAGLSIIGKWLSRRRGTHGTRTINQRPKEKLTIGMLQAAINLGMWDTVHLRE